MNIPRLERKYIPNLRKSKVYKFIKLALIIPFVLPIYYIKLGITRLIGLVTIKRANKPDIVFQNIVDGWKNLVLYNEVVEQVAIKRAEICSKCPSAKFSNGVHTIVVDNQTKHIRGLYCDECNCPLSAKVRSSNDYCPLRKW
jgi:hypothetical protein